MALGPRVTDRVHAAQATARSAAAKVQRVSAARLTELLRLPPSERLAHLDDPVLVTTDRAALRRSLKASLPRRQLRLRFPVSGPSARRCAAALARLGITPEIVVPLFLLMAWLGSAWTHTAHIVTLTQDVPVRDVSDNRHAVDLVLPKGRSIIVVTGWDKVPRLRQWLPGRGYETVPLPADAISRGLPSRSQSVR